MSDSQSDVQSFDAATRLEQVDESTFKADIPDGWQQGRGAFGGLVIGLCLRALDSLREDPTRVVRSASAALPSPVGVGEALLEVRALRRGSGLDALEVDVRQEGEVRAKVTAIYGKPRPVDVTDRPEPPAFPDIPDPAPAGPAFSKHFEMRPTGPLPFGGGAEAVVAGWVGPRVPFASVGAPEIACLCDVFWPSFFATVTAFRPAATVGYTLQTTPAAYELEPGELLFYRARQLHAAGGFSHELRELWRKDGELVALNPQTFTIIK